MIKSFSWKKITPVAEPVSMEELYEVLQWEPPAAAAAGTQQLKRRRVCNLKVVIIDDYMPANSKKDDALLLPYTRAHIVCGRSCDCGGERGVAQAQQQQQ